MENAEDMLEENRIDLILKPGEIKTLSPRRYLLRTLEVPNGARIVVPEGGRQWLILDVSNNATLNGHIIYRKSSVQDGEIISNAPNGDVLRFVMPPRVKGGDGGHGGGWSGLKGASGSKGTVDYGGGGGSGAWYTQVPPPGAGVPADGWHGGHAQHSDAIGGDGGIAHRNSNGGFVYLNVAGTFSGSGTVDVRGENGLPGNNGGKGVAGRGWGAAGGGGGGGGPGGSGGAIYIRASNNESLIQTLLDGGKGGSRGMAVGHGASNGYDGEPGALGIIDWY